MFRGLTKLFCILSYLFNMPFYMFAALLKIILRCVILKLLYLSKFLERISGAREETNNSEQQKEDTFTSKSKGKNKGKARQRAKKTSDEPTFNTKLTTPIEDVIKETIKEEGTDLSATSERLQKLPKKQERKEKLSEEDTVGFSFFKTKSTAVHTTTSKNSFKKADNPICEEKPLQEDIGFSFLPVKERGRRTKSKSLLEKKNSEEALQTVIEQGYAKKADLSKPSIIEHYQKKPRSGSPGKVSVESQNTFIYTKKSVEYKESKKVTAQISYASIVNNTGVVDDKNSLEPGNLVKENEYTSSTEVVSEYSENFHIVDNETSAIEPTLSKDSFVHIENRTDNLVHSARKEGIHLIDSVNNFIEARDDTLNYIDNYFENPVEHINNKADLNLPTTEDHFDIIGVNIEEENLDTILDEVDGDRFVSQDSQVSSLKSAKATDDIFHATLSKGINQKVTKDSKDSKLTEELQQFKFYDWQQTPIKNQSAKSVTQFFINEQKNQGIEEKGLDVVRNSNGIAESREFLKVEVADIGGTETTPKVEKSFPEEIIDSNSETVKVLVKCDQDSNSIEVKHTDFNLSRLESEILSYRDNLQQNSTESRLENRVVEDHLIVEESPVKITKELLKADSKPAPEVTEEICVKKSAYTTGNLIEAVGNIPKLKNIEAAPSSEDNNMTQIRVLTLNDKEHQESTIYRIEKNWTLQFRLGPSLLGRKIKLYLNYPKETNEFERGTYQLLEWCQDEGCKHADDTATFAQIVPKISGSFHYYFVYENEEDKQGSGYILVDPVLTYGKNEELPLDCIQCQTVLTKHLGPFSSWEQKLSVTKESGYNMVHFTPVQELGASKSSYSLSEQLKLNPMFNEEDGRKPSFDDLEKFANNMRREMKMLSICDIVLNHTANESKWLLEHPEVTYNCVNCPYMRPAYLLDAAFHQFSIDVKKGLYEDRGIPAEVSTEEHLNAIRYHFKMSVLDPLKLEELFIVDVNKCISEFLELARKTQPVSDSVRITQAELKIIQDPDFRRLKSTVDVELAVNLYNVYRSDSFDEDARMKKCSEDLKNKLDSLNREIVKELSDDLSSAVENVIAGIRYFRVQDSGPKITEITESNPLVYRYFTDYGSPKSLNEHEEIMYSQNGSFLMAHNGWVMNSDPLKNFASPGTKTYIRRELIAWSDSVKLRYGDKPEDSPFLWAHMRKYVEQTARIFDGVRLDNCHSTPLHVAEYLLDCARRVRPDLYVVAELFTNSDLTDNIFVNRLGITSLIREAMSAWDSHELGRLVYRYGGVPVGSFYQPRVRPLVPTVAHALFLDLSHDNPSPVEKRSVFDLLPSTALVNMACCASGSNRGYDELVPHHIHVVDETRQYTEWSDDDELAVENRRYVGKKSGIIAAKRALNELHYKLGRDGYNQVYVDQMDPDVVAVTRHNPETHQSYVLIAFTAFGHPDQNADKYQRGIRPVRVEGVLEEIVLEATLSHVEASSGGSKYTKFDDFTKDSAWISGLTEYRVTVREHISSEQSEFFNYVDSGTPNVFQLDFRNFKPGSVAVLKVSLPEDMRESISRVRSLIKSFPGSKDTELKRIVSRLTLADLNRALYRCDQEERDEGFGFDAYNIPNFGPVVYCGLQGFISLLANIRPSNDLGHPMCANLRDGNWMIEYIWKRLKVDQGTKELGQWIEENTKSLEKVPRYLVPCYFDVIVTGIYINLLDHSYSLMSDFVKNGSTFVRCLSLGSLQFGAYIKSADLPTLSPNLRPPKPPTRRNDKGEVVQACVTLSAGLPHFSVGYMRNWGRDTFIALRGLFILTGRYEEARQHILGYAACLRHGLIPNLLDGGRNSRFNCRDAVWWWLYCIKSYCEEVPKGVDIMADTVSRIFPTDDSPAQPAGVVNQPLHDVIQEALNVHFQGLRFRERNAGGQIDEHMTDAGFNNQIGIHPETGFVFGGNQWNCGTWMDKMGSSDKAGNRGKPATPRDGSAVELVGLSKAAVSWLWKLNREGKYPYDGVQRTHKNGAITKWTFKEWADKIRENFEKKFFVRNKPSCDEERPDLVNKRDIYKDTYGGSQPWTDYQLRCNFPIAMVAAPEMFNPSRAWAALQQTEKYLLGPLGMKTLDPEDWNYRGDYDNSNDSSDFHTSHGFNYHQGPEWVWPIGFFLRARLIFASQNGMLKETVASTKVILSKHFTELQTSLWRGLPELTNSNGAFCKDSSRTQAWSMACVLEVLRDLQQIESKEIFVN
ncbi:glycogen debranching enzyme [Cylas formicarius]|uniref:glycogen debranching enzyme n=1 Tax=Cylas formicarius TaxID=197179 RepID=UPI002958B8B9|nr:glycogen debranching enzyme [Cylas formicarius]